MAGLERRIAERSREYRELLAGMDNVETSDETRRDTRERMEAASQEIHRQSERLLALKQKIANI